MASLPYVILWAYSSASKLASQTKKFLPYHSCNKHFVYVMYTGYTDKFCVQSSYN